MGRKITLKLVIVYIATVVCMFFMLSALGKFKVQQALLENRQEVMKNEAVTMASEYGDNYYHSGISLSELSKQLNSIDKFLDMRVMITNAKGLVFLDTRGNRSVDLSKYIDGTPEECYTNVSLPELSEEPLMLVCEPIESDYSIKGYLCLAVTMQSIYKDTNFYIDTISTLILLFSAILLLVFVLIYVMTVWPIAILKKTAIEYARKNYDYVCPQKLHDEYHDTVEAMRVTAEEVERLEDYQKKFVGNVSHDFRSPLTSIKGYIEAIKDGTIPIEAADRYLDIILFETERLTKLTEDLLTLSRMDNKVELEITAFDVNSLIKKTCETFEGTCTKKRISFDLEFCEPEVFISADFSRVQQVVYNLVDNAIKFSNSDSSIIISVNIKSSKAMISVKDSGLGIPGDAQKKIFERFYKTDLSRGKDKRGTGLGLAIVKEIIEAHNENITVVSTEGVGTEFTFSMPLAEM